MSNPYRDAPPARDDVVDFRPSGSASRVANVAAVVGLVGFAGASAGLPYAGVAFGDAAMWLAVPLVLIAIGTFVIGTVVNDRAQYAAEDRLARERLELE